MEYLKTLFLECLEENQQVVEQLGGVYKLIQVYFFHEVTDPKAGDSLRRLLNDQNIKDPKSPIPAFANSRKNIGCIMVFVKHLLAFTQKRTDFTDIKAYQKNGIFEELCHLVEQKGDASIHPESYWALWRLYKNRNLLQYGNEIIAQLDTDRNHYEVYLMMIEAYPNDWVKRYWKYFMGKNPEQYEREYQQWKNSLEASDQITINIKSTNETFYEFAFMDEQNYQLYQNSSTRLEAYTIMEHMDVTETSFSAVINSTGRYFLVMKSDAIAGTHVSYEVNAFRVDNSAMSITLFMMIVGVFLILSVSSYRQRKKSESSMII